MTTRYPNLCRSFAEEASRVWRDMNDADHLGIARQEETITEELLLSLARKHHGRGLNIKSFTRTEESANGADWAFWISGSGRKGIELRLQAKRLYRKSRRYESLFHQSDKQKKLAAATGGDTPNQCETLIENRGTAIPLYVFYNSDALPIGKGHIAHAMYSPISVPVYQETWGISAASAFTVRAADWGKTNSPGDLCSIPWHFLFCNCVWPDRPTETTLPALVGNGLRNLFRGTGLIDTETINFEPHESQPTWVDLLKEGHFMQEKLLELMRELNLKGIAEISEQAFDE
jgi:hypothetical protein